MKMRQEFTSKVFMVRPAHFGRNSETLETNSFQSKITYNTESEIAEKAIFEFLNRCIKFRQCFFRNLRLAIEHDF